MATDKLIFTTNDVEAREKRIDAAVSELVKALMEKYPGATLATVTINKGNVRINVASTESRVVKIDKM